MKPVRVVLTILLAVSSLFSASPQRLPKKPPPQEKPWVLDVNRASAEDFQKLPGIGPELAERIVLYRQRHGPFRRVEDLLAVRGIGPKKWRRLRPHLRVSAPGGKGEREDCGLRILIPYAGLRSRFHKCANVFGLAIDVQLATPHRLITEPAPG